MLHYSCYHNETLSILFNYLINGNFSVDWRESQQLNLALNSSKPCEWRHVVAGGIHVWSCNE